MSNYNQLKRYKMKKLLYSLMAMAMLSVMFVSCSGCSNKSEQEEEIPVFAKGDTTQVIALVEHYLDLMKDNQVDSAINMLHEFYGDSIASISDSAAQLIRNQVKVFPVLRYHRASMDFVDAHDVTIAYAVEFFEKPDPKDSIHNTIRMDFAPVRINAEWYLGIKVSKEIK